MSKKLKYLTPVFRTVDLIICDVLASSKEGDDLISDSAFD